MAATASRNVLTEALWPAEGSALWVKRVVLVVLGVAALALSAKVSVPVWPSPVPITLGTLAVLTIGAAYGPRLGLVTILAYLAIGALGFDVFAGSSAAGASSEVVSLASSSIKSESPSVSVVERRAGGRARRTP